jgi:hypothetical protein
MRIFLCCIGCCLVIFTLAVLPGCKTKYLELQSQYQKAKLKKTELEKENKKLTSEIKILKDSLSVVKTGLEANKLYVSQIHEIELLKKDFLLKRVPYFVAEKKRQVIPVKNKTK